MDDLILKAFNLEIDYLIDRIINSQDSFHILLHLEIGL